MAPDPNKPAGKAAPKRPRAARKKPSFEPAPVDRAETGWAYRSDAVPHATPPRPAAPRRPNLIETALDCVVVPIGIALMAVLAPVGALRASRRK